MQQYFVRFYKGRTCETFLLNANTAHEAVAAADDIGYEQLVGEAKANSLREAASWVERDLQAGWTDYALLSGEPGFVGACDQVDEVLVKVA